MAELIEQPEEQNEQQYDWIQEFNSAALSRTIYIPSLSYYKNTYGSLTWDIDYVRYE